MLSLRLYILSLINIYYYKFISNPLTVISIHSLTYFKQYFHCIYSTDIPNLWGPQTYCDELHKDHGNVISWHNDKFLN